MTSTTPPRDIKSMLTRSDGRGLFRLASHAALLAGSAGTLHVTAGTPAWLVASIVHGVLLAFLFCPLHETIHRTAFASRRVNDAVARVCGFVLLLPPRFFRAFHLAHHRHTQDYRLDPELAAPKPATLPAYLRYVSGIPYWRERIRTTARHATARVTEPFVAADRKHRIVREARMVVAAYALLVGASIWFRSTALLEYWIVPILLGQPLLRLFLLAEHTGCAAVPDMFENSRTTLTNTLVRLVTWNMPYHTAHHRYPAVPFFSLPALHARLSDRVDVTSPSYTAFHREYLRSICTAAPGVNQ